MHHTYGDSVYGWTFAAVLFQLLIRIKNAMLEPDVDVEAGEYRQQAYLEHIEPTIDVLRRKRITVEGLLKYRPYRYRMFEVINAMGMYLHGLHYINNIRQAIKDKDLIKTTLIGWLFNTFNRSLMIPGFSQQSFYFAKPGFYADPHDVVHFRRQPNILESNREPYIVIRSGLFSHALYSMILEFQANGVLKSCPMCGKLMLHKSKKGVYCGNTCVQAAKRQRQKG